MKGFILKEFSHCELVDKASGEVIDLSDPDGDVPDDIIRDIVSGDVEVHPIYVASKPVINVLEWALEIADPGCKGIISGNDRVRMTMIVNNISVSTYGEAQEFVNDFLMVRGIRSK